MAVPTVMPPRPPVAKGGADAAQGGGGDNSDDGGGDGDEDDGAVGSSCGSDSGTATATPAASADVLSSQGADDWRSLPRADGHGGPAAPPHDAGAGATAGPAGYQPLPPPGAAPGNGGWGLDVHTPAAADQPGYHPQPSVYVAASPKAAPAAPPTRTGDDSFPSPPPPPVYPELSPSPGGDALWTPPAAAPTVGAAAAGRPFDAPGATGLVAPESACVFCLGPVGGAGVVGACGHPLCAPCGARVRMLMNKCPSCGGPLS